MSEGYSLAGEGVIWIQPDGPNTEPKVLACHLLGDVAEPQGDVTLFYCPDPEIPNKFNVKGSFQGVPGAITFSIETDMMKTFDYLESVRCPVPIYVGKVSCGRKNVFSAYDRMFIMENSRITSKGMSNMVAMDPASQERTRQKFDISTESMLRVFKREAARVAIAETEGLNSITNCSEFQCSGDCGDITNKGDNMFVGGDTLAGSPLNTSDVWETDDAASSWALVPTDPFDAAEVIASIRCVKIDRDTVRIIVARGTTDAGNPAEIAYSDDRGVTWTRVNVGTINGAYFTGPKSLFILDYYNIWACTTGGYIYKSSDGGGTWVAQTSGTLSVQNLNAIDFYDSLNGFAVGNLNVVLKTTDGGTVWSIVTAPVGGVGNAVLSVHVLSKNRVFIGYGAIGALYYTHNGGTDWYVRTTTVSGTGSIVSMDWLDEYVGVFIHNTAAIVGTIWWTVNGGYTWEAVPLSEANSGLNDVIILDENTAFVVGEIDGGTAMIYKVSGG